MTRFIIGLALLYLLLVAIDPDTYAVFGWAAGLFMVFMAMFVARISKGAGAPVFAIGILMFCIAMFGAEYYETIRIVAACAIGIGLLTIFSRLSQRRRPAARERRNDHQHQET